MTSRKPNLFLVGAPRCGTTSLYTYLSEHPSVFMSPVKELHYFSRDLFQPPPQAAFAHEADYLAEFAGAGDERWVGEASPFYLYSSVAADAIRAFSPDARVVVTLRNPADMMYSMYCHRVRAALFHPAQETARSFERALADGAERLRGRALPPGAPTEPGRCLYLCYEELGRYADRVRRVIEVFGRKAVHVVIFDDLVSDTPRTFAELCHFLEIDPSYRPDFNLSVERRAGSARPRSAGLSRFLWRPHRSVTKVAQAILPARIRGTIRDRLRGWNDRPPAPLRPETRRRLLDSCANDVRRLSELIGRDLEPWLEPEPGATQVRGDH
jgi:hypothetical protein